MTYNQKEVYDRLMSIPLNMKINTVWDTLNDNVSPDSKWQHVVQNNQNFICLFLSLVAKKINLDDIRVIFDIGSLNGIEAIYFSQLLPNCRVYSFEANPTSFLHVKDNQKNYPNISQHQVAISDYVGKTQFHITPANVGASSLLKPLQIAYNPAGTGFVSIDVDCTTVDKFCDDNGIDKVDLIWMDLQGNELNALKGASKRLGNVTGICSEIGLVPYYENHTLYPQIKEYLESFGLTREENIQWTHNHNVGHMEDDMIFLRNT
jgi:FkbM family methyltransferase